MTLKQTPSQTVGPYFAYGLTPGQYGYDFKDIAGPTVISGEGAGEAIRIVGQVFDGEGVPISDAMVEIWQADGEGRYAHPADRRETNSGFRGFGRSGTGTDPLNRFLFETVRPGSVEAGSAPHINVMLFMRGMLTHAYTRIYFEDDQARTSDPVLNSVPQDRRHTLIARREPGGGMPVYRFDIHMQGDNETVFFDV